MRRKVLKNSKNYFMNKIKKSFYKKFYRNSKMISNIDDNKLLNICKIMKSLNKKNKIILAGNGGSASMASHVAVDFAKF